MFTITNLSSIFQSRKVTFVSSLVLLGLLIVSIYDSVQIIHTYVNDNRVTFVSTVNIGENATLPYLENLFFTLDPGFTLLFPELPAKLFYEPYSKTLKEEVLNGSFSLDNVNISDIYDRVKMVEIFSIFNQIDSRGFNCAGKGPYCINTESRNEYGWAANFTHNLTSLDNLEKKLWPYVRKRLLLDTTNLSDYLFVDPPSFREVTVELATSRVLKGKKADFWLEFGVSRPSSSSTLFLEIATKSTDFKPIELSSAKHCAISMQIANIGVFDKSGTTECRKDPDLIISGDKSDRRAFLQSFVKQCNCVPFTYKRHYFMIADSDAVRHPPLCNIDAYILCSNKTIEIDESKNLPACVKVKNQYQFSTYWQTGQDYNCSLSDLDNGQRMCILSTLSLQSSADFYAQYTELYQLTATQFIGQLGGDIGLYTGLSILSIWQLLLYLYHKYSKHKSVYKKPSKENKSDTSVRYLFYKAYIISLLRDIEESMVNGGQDNDHGKVDEERDQKPDDNEMTEIEKNLGFDRKLERYTERFEAMEARLEKSDQKMEHLQSIVMGIAQRLVGIEISHEKSTAMLEKITEKLSST